MNKEMLAEKQREFLHLFDDMPEVEIWDKGTKDNKCVFSHAKFLPAKYSPTNKPLIIFSPKTLYNQNQATILEILKHELIHAWLDWKGEPIYHGIKFFRKAVELKLDWDLKGWKESGRTYAKLIKRAETELE